MFLTLMEGITATEQMVCTSTMNMLVLPAGAIIVEVEGGMRGWGLNLAALPRETLYQL